MYYEMKTERLLLRPLNISDLQTVHIYASDNNNTTYMCFLPNETIDETACFLKKVTIEWEKETPSFYEFAIDFNGSQIGAISVYLNESKDIGELGWILNKLYWRKGIAFEAACAVKDFSFNTLKLKKIIACCDYRNTASYNLMKKLGMTLENDTGTRTYSKSNETVKELVFSLAVQQ